MANPTEKSKEINDFLSTLAGKAREQTIRDGECMGLDCTDPDFNFKDDVSAREYRISGLCQTCQDEIWGEGPFDDYEWDGYPDEAQEWYDYDPDC